jgi:hypothetical protein
MTWVLLIIAILVCFALYAENHRLILENIELDRDNAQLQRDLASMDRELENAGLASTSGMTSPKPGLRRSSAWTRKPA